MKTKHTAKSVGLAPAFPLGTPFLESGQANECAGMTFAQYLYAHNITASQAPFDAHDKEFGGDFGGTQNGFADYVRKATMAQLSEVANMLNELEAMEDGK